MKRFLLPILLIVLLFAGLGAGIWLLTSRGSESVPRGTAAADGAAKPAAEAPVALEGPGAGEAKPASERSAELPAPPAGALLLRGTVRAPAGIRDPGPLFVYALSDSASYRDFARMQERKAPDPDKGGTDKAGTDKAGKDQDELRVSAQCKAGADGSFELPLPDGTTRVHLALQGRFLYLDHTRDLELARAGQLQLLPKAGAYVSGSVKLPEGIDLAALEALRVEIDPVIRGAMAMRPDRPPHRSVPASGGNFELRAVPVDADYRTNIESEAFAFVEQLLAKLRAGESRTLELQLELGGTLRGVVQDPDGKPRGGAGVEASREGDWFGVDDKQVRSGKSDESGAFELAHVPAGKLKLRATAAGLLPSERQELELPAGRVVEGVALVLREGKSVAGTVSYADGKPAAGAEVQASFDLSQAGGMGAFNAMEGGEAKSKTDAEGHFTVAGLGKGPFTVRASGLPAGETAPAGGKKDEDALLRARTDGVTPGTLDLALVLRESQLLHGRVVDSAQQPVTKFKLKVQHEGKGLMAGLGQDSQERAIADAEGRFKVGGLSEGNWKLWITAEHFANSDALPVTLPQASDAPELVITLQPCCTVSGRVVSAKGEPVGGARVTTDGGGPDWQKALSGAPADPTTDSDADGSFRLDGLKPGHVALAASATDHARSLPQALELVVGVETKDVTLTLRDGGSISGEVYDEQGKPLASMFVQATEMALFDIHFESSDGEGRFKLEHLQPGHYQVVAFPGKALGKAGSDAGAAFMSSMKMTTAEVRDGEDTHVILGAPPADPVQVVGRVTQAGQPYTGAMVSFIHEGKDVISKMKNAQVDAQGAFEVRLDEPGRYSVQVQRISGGMNQQNMVEFQRDIPKEKRFEFVIEMPLGRISGKVQDPEGNPAQGERVSLRPRSALVGGSIWGGMYVEAQTDGDGKYDIQTLRPGDYVLSVGGMAMGGIFGGDAAHGREMRTDLKVGEGDWLRDIDFRLRKPGKVDVTVVGEDDQPIAKAAIFARDANGFLLDRLSLVATDESGVAHYGGLAPGEYNFSSRLDVRASAEGARVKLGEGEAKTVKLVLQGASVLLVTVQDSDGKTVQAAVSVLDSQGHEAGGMYGLSELMDQFSKNGLDFTVARVGPLPPGKYTVTARTADGKTGTKPVTLTGQPERKLTIRVE
jgi:protocatechuate 3,4-dioxygenase beta subunit